MSKGNILDTLIITDSEIVFKKFHVARTKEAFQYLNIYFDSEIENSYDAIEKEYTERMLNGESLRLLFSASAPLSYKVEIKKIEKLNPIIKLSTQKLEKQPDADSAFKWEKRDDWNLILKEKKYEADDVLAINTQNDIVETSRFNIFCYDKIADSVYTPELESGCINGVFRRFALSNNSIQLPDIGNKKIFEKNIKLDELHHYRLFVANSVRGICPANLILD